MIASPACTRLRWFSVAICLALGATACGEGESASSGSGYRAPRTAFNHPDLQGVWSNNSATPLQRPAAWADKEFLSEAEVEQLKRAAADVVDEGGDALFGDELITDAIAGKTVSESRDSTTGNYNQFWLPDRDFDNRTSLIADPPDGRIPPVTPQAQQKRAADAERRKLFPADGPESRGLGERCITFGVPRFQAAYNSFYQILQTSDHVVVYMEMLHDARIIPLDQRPHVPEDIPQWLGDARGRWEGETLVVETRRFSPKSNFMGASNGLTLVERFTRIGPDTLQYEATMTDPTTWTAPWTVRIPLKRSDAKIYEYACHEGNLGMVGILAGAREQERASLTARR